MGYSMKKSLSMFIMVLIVVLCVNVNRVLSANFEEALTKSLFYFEAQRSGKLPEGQRVKWRDDSALKDGQEVGEDLVGGYYDAGDNVKFGFPLAYTITMLAWSVVEYGKQLNAQNELVNALTAIRWGTDYFIKAHPVPNLLYAQVGEGESDHKCWERPEDMTTPRTVFKIDDQKPGSDLAAETAAAFAAASIAFKTLEPDYSAVLLTHAKQLYDFAKARPGKYSDSIPAAGKFYSSSGFQDELMWGAAWLYKATNENSYKEMLGNSAPGGTRTMFSWDDKYVGAQILAAKEVLLGKAPNGGNWGQHKQQVEQYLCNCMQKGSSNVARTGGGLLYFDGWNNLQYTTSASFALTVYADYLSASGQALKCPSSLVNPPELTAFATSQVEYILGENPQKRSYMVGYGSNYPQKIHHRGASIISIKQDRTPVGCDEGMNTWFKKAEPNPNVLIGAIVGGPDKSDNYEDSRSNYQMGEPSTSTVPPLVGVLARISQS